MLRVLMMIKMALQVFVEENKDVMTGDTLDELNLEIHSKDEVKHT